MNIELTPKQMLFVEADADEILYGGAAGGGKSHGQVIDALLFACRYPRSKQLILRRTYKELDMSIVRTSLSLYPREIATYNDSKHIWTFKNGSIVEFGYCDNDKDVYRYQSAEFDVIRFDELTHFTEDMYVYLISRVRGANSYPKSIKSTTNPGGVGHAWVKERFIDVAAPGKKYDSGHGTRIFIPASVKENSFLMANDPGYLKRLENLNERDKKALLYGDWDITEGRYFPEFKRDIHVVEPFPIPADWRRYFAMDYGLDMLAGYWIAMDWSGRAYVYREIYESNLIVSAAAERVLAETPYGEDIDAYIAPPDLWNRRQDTGRSAADIFADSGLYLVKANNDRTQGLYDLKEWLKVIPHEDGGQAAGVVIFSTCLNLIRSMTAIQVDAKNPNVTANEPHELTHSVDALRYFVAGRPSPNIKPIEEDEDAPSEDYQLDALFSFGR